MKARIAALIAAAGAAAAAAGAAVWNKRMADEDEAREAEILAAYEAEAMAGIDEAPGPDVAQIPADPDPPAELTTPRGDAAGDDLTVLKGIGAVSAERLAGIGVTTYAQLAAWSDEDVDAHGERIRVSPERIRREDWVGQAREMAAGGGTDG